ncbi:hypothetical protein MRX96_011098 [Rhipicephalus microplus]
MYSPDKYCDYIFYINVLTAHGQIHSEKDSSSWNVTAADSDDDTGELDELRRQGIRHCGLLTVLELQSEFSSTIMSSKPVIKKLMKEMQGVDRNAKTVLAIGSYDYCHNFINEVKRYFTDVANSPTIYEKPFNDTYHNSDKYNDNNLRDDDGNNLGDDHDNNLDDDDDNNRGDDDDNNRGDYHYNNHCENDYDYAGPRPRYVTPGSLEHVADILGGLRRLRIKHYGFLTALTFAGEYRVTLQFIRVLMGGM